MPHLGMGELVILLVLVGLAALVMVVLGGRASPLSASQRALDDGARSEAAAAMPLTRICEAREGDWIRVTGEVEGSAGDPELRAPLGGEYGVAHRSVVVPSGPARVPLVAPVADERRAIDFLLGDGTGRARVVASGARVILPLRPIEPPLARVDAWLARRGAEPVPGAACEEAVLASRDRVTVAGRARWEDDPHAPQSDPAASYRTSVGPRRLVLESAPGRVMVVTDSKRATASVADARDRHDRAAVPEPHRRETPAIASGGEVGRPWGARRIALGLVLGTVAFVACVVAAALLMAPPGEHDPAATEPRRIVAVELGTPSAMEYLRARHAEVLETLGQDPPDAARDAAVAAILDELVDFGAVTRASFGEHWDATPPLRRIEAVWLIAELCRSRYLAELVHLRDLDVAYVDDEAMEDRTRVVTTAVSPPEPPAWRVEIAYTLHRADGLWRVIDVRTDGTSMVENYRRQIAHHIAEEGIDGLLARLRNRVARARP